MQKLTLSILASLFALPVFAGQLPVQVNRDANGKVDTIVLTEKKSLDGQEADAFLDGLALGIDEVNRRKGEELDGAKNLKKDEQAALADARAYLSNKSVVSFAERKQLNDEFRKAVKELNSQKLFHVLAAPNSPSYFDGEKVLEEVIRQITGQAGSVLGATPVYSVFEFLVDEYLNALVARREFFQNAVLVSLDHADTEYTAEEKSAIRSSIFYSRISLTNLPKRMKAAKAWATYGDKEAANYMKKCKTNASTFVQSCFTQVDNKARNLMVKRHILSGKTSLALDFANPASVGNSRWMFMAIKLGVKLAPVPGLLKKPVNMFLNSLYTNQRTSEGLLYGELMYGNYDVWAQFVVGNNANPTF